MPVYLYSCKKCGEFETMQSINDPPLEECPTCIKKKGKSKKPKRLIGSTSFILNGGGWAKDKYSK
jgi:putative FmdB family regulatory protein